MTLRTDHLAGGFCIVFALGVLALSGDLPVGSLSFPGAGMMPKLVACLVIVFGAILVLRAGTSPPVAEISWKDVPHALRVAVITTAAVALYQWLGFIITMTLLLFALIWGAERRNPVAAGVYSLGVTLLTWVLFDVALKTPLDKGIFGF